MKILIVDDEPGLLELLTEYLRGEGHEVKSAASVGMALQALEQFRPGLILLDQNLPDQRGTDAMDELRAAGAGAHIVIITGQADVTSAVEAMRLGAQDYLPKPLDLTRLRLILGREEETLRLRGQLDGLRRFQLERYQKEHVLLADAKMERVYRQVEKVSNLKKVILIQGEAGTGKEHVARLIHFMSAQAAGPFIEVHCGAVAAELFERELFGYEQGAVAGALGTKPGLLETAAGGTLYLDQVAELSLGNQAKLLLALESAQVRRVGGGEARPLNLRIIASTDRDLEHEAAAGRFRKELFYALNGLAVQLPPLRQVKGDIGPLAQHFFDEVCKGFGADTEALPPAVLQRLTDHAWPGNVRELKNLMERLVLTRSESGPDWDLLDELLEYQPLSESALRSVQAAPFQGSLEEAERKAILEALRECKGNRTRAADRLGINRKTLFNKLREWEKAGQGGPVPR